MYEDPHPVRTAVIAHTSTTAAVPRSIAARLMPTAIRIRGAKKVMSSAAATIAEAHRYELRPQQFAPPKRLDRTVDISVRHRDGWPVYTVRARINPAERRALYSHGGGWTHEISPWHWKLIAELATATGTEFTVPIYPLAPRGTADAVIPVIADLAGELVDAVGAANVTLIGDSAGGTITVAAAMMLRDRGLQPAPDLVLISPVVDLAFENPRIAEIAPDDPWLAVPGLRAAADMWCGPLDISDPRVSPVHGRLSGIGRITLFSGTHDITNADAHTLVGKALSESHPLDFHEQAEMLHVYPLLPIPEGARARRLIAGVLEKSRMTPERCQGSNSRPLIAE